MLTDDQKLTLLTQAGVKVDDAQELIETPAKRRTARAVVMDPVLGETLVYPPAPTSIEISEAYQRIIAKSYADKAKALDLCDVEGKTHFDAHKLSKVQAAVAGVERTSHNKSMWADAQRIVVTLKRMVRDHYAVHSVKAKIAASKAALPQEVREISNEKLERLLASEAFLALLRQEES